MFRDERIIHELVLKILCGKIVAEIFLALANEVPKFSGAFNWSNIPVSIGPPDELMEQSCSREQITALRKSERITRDHVRNLDISTFVCPCAPLALTIERIRAGFVIPYSSINTPRDHVRFRSTLFSGKHNSLVFERIGRKLPNRPNFRLKFCVRCRIFFFPERLVVQTAH